MSYIKILLVRNLNPLLKPSINPNFFPKFPNFFSTQIENPIIFPQKHQKKPQKKKNKRPLDIVFKEALGLCEKIETLGNFNEKANENGDLIKKLFNLEMEIRELKALSSEKEEKKVSSVEKELIKEKDDEVSKAKPSNLKDLFSKKVVSGVVCNEISEDMKMLLKHMYECGYFKDANFLPGNRFDVSCFYEDYAKDYVKCALQRFGNDQKDVSKWLSGSDAKAIAQFGCPTLNNGDILAAKKLRSFFKIREETICGNCVLNKSCKHRNKSAGKGENTMLRLDSLLRLLRTYSMEEISPALTLTDDMKDCVSRLIHEVVKFTKDAGQSTDEVDLS